ncbi:MAG TPA: hypothetical protein VGK63_09855 [Candidatus Limnocylindrales bacterium]
MTSARTAAIGGERFVPVPDEIAAEYLLLALRLGQRIEGLVDGYFGPADLKARADMEPLPSPDSLVADAERLRERVAREVPEPDRRDWLDRQLVALGTHARRLAGERLPYLDEIRLLFDWQPERRPDERFHESAARLDDLLPGHGSVPERLAAWDEVLTVPESRLPALVDWLLATFRDRASEAFGLPGGETLHVRFVRDRPWGGYNWYDGGLRSRVDINLDLPVRLTSLLSLLAHEGYPGHHLEHAWKERDLVDRRARLEGSVLLLNAPECVISEGLADLGRRFAVPGDGEIDLLAEAIDRAAIAGPGPSSARQLAERAVAVAGPREVLDEVAVNAAILRHADDRSHDEVLAYLVEVGRMAAERAAKRLEFIEHPVTRSYVFVYAEGEALLARWLEAVPAAQRAGRFARLLHEQLTPSAIAAEIEAGTGRAVSGPTTTR